MIMMNRLNRRDTQRVEVVKIRSEKGEMI